MTVRCVLLDDFQGVGPGMADWEGIDVEVRSVRKHPADEDELVEMIGNSEVVVTLRERIPFPASTFARLPNLQLLVASGMRNSVIDLEAARRHKVTVCGTRSYTSPPVELTWALILGLARHLVTESTLFRAGGPWQSTVGTDLAGRRLGLLGVGKVGAGVAAVGLAFGMQVTAWSENLTDERARDVGVRRAPNKESLLRTSDIVSVHLALGERTRNTIGADEIALMPRGSLLVNTARSAIVDQQALVAGLVSGHLGGAAVDVFDSEPLPPDHPMRSTPRLLATPHLGYVTHRNYRQYYEDAAENIRCYLSGAPMRVLGD